MKKKTVADFEVQHGQPKLKEMERKLEVERAKVEALAGNKSHVTIQKQEDCTFRIGVTGDRHFGSLYHAEDSLASFYEYAQSQGVKDIYDAGDILSGWKVFKGHEFELRDIGLDAQVQRVASSTPKTKIVTNFITGNHDASFKNQVGVSVGNLIQNKVKGYNFLGEEQATVIFDTPKGQFSLMLLHPGGGSSYALSYRPQKIVESLEGGKKPNMLAIGHYHKAEMLPSYRNVAVFQAGTFERQTPFMARQGLAAHVGGWIVEVTVGETYNTIKGEFVAFY